MNQWFRSWHGAPTDPKWRVIAKKADVPTSLVVSFIWALMDRASQSDDRGSFEGVDLEVLADYLDCDETQLKRIVTQCNARNVTCDDRFVSWEKRQPKKEDTGSTQRVQKHRELKKLQSLSYHETPCNVLKRDETTDKIREDKNINKLYLSETSSDAQVLEFPEKAKQNRPKRQRHAYSAAFEEFWQAYPTDPLMSKAQAAKQFERLSDDDQRRAIAAVPAFRAHCHKTPDYRPVHAERFISQRRFDGFARGSPEAIPFDPVAHQANLDRILGRTKANA